MSSSGEASPEERTLLVLRIEKELEWGEIATVLSAEGLPISAAALRTAVGQLADGRRVEVEPIVSTVDQSLCIGCGMCEHECPVSGLRAIRVYSENESRSRQGRMLS